MDKIMDKKIIKYYADADKLMKMGFRCLGVDKNKYDEGKIIFWFENTPELRIELEKMLNSRKNRQ